MLIPSPGLDPGMVGLQTEEGKPCDHAYSPGLDPDDAPKAAAAVTARRASVRACWSASTSGGIIFARFAGRVESSSSGAIAVPPPKSERATAAWTAGRFEPA